MKSINLPNHNIRAFYLLQIANAIDISMTFFALVLRPDYLRYEMNGFFRGSIAHLFAGNIIPVIIAVALKISIFLALGLIIVYKPFPDKFVKTLMTTASMYFFATMTFAGLSWFILALSGTELVTAIQDLTFAYIPILMAFFWLNMDSERSETQTTIP